MQECNASKNLARNAIEARVLQEFFMEPKENALSRNDCIFLNHDQTASKTAIMKTILKWNRLTLLSSENVIFYSS